MRKGVLGILQSVKEKAGRKDLKKSDSIKLYVYF